MECRIDRAIRNMFLRRKLRLIEARRIKYPQTFEGRKKYVRDGLKPHRGKLLFILLIIAGILGLIALFAWLILDEHLSQGQFNLMVVLVIVAMLTILCGFSGLRNLKEGGEL